MVLKLGDELLGYAGEASAGDWGVEGGSLARMLPQFRLLTLYRGIGSVTLSKSGSLESQLEFELWPSGRPELFERSISRQDLPET